MKLIKTSLAYGNKWIQIYVKRYKLNSGAEEDYFVIGNKSEIAAIFAVDGEELILVRQYRWAVDSYTNDIPGGGVEEGETPLEAAKRELLEETGYEAGQWELLCSRYLDSGQKDCVQHIFLAQDLQACPAYESETDIQISKRPLTEQYTLLNGTTDGPIESTLAVALAAYQARYNLGLQQRNKLVK